MNDTPIATPVVSDTGEVLGLVIHLESGRALRDSDGNLPLRWAYGVANQSSARAIEPHHIGGRH